MVFWFMMFLTDLLVPGMMLGVGWWFRKAPPREINCIYGYRTTRSMKNQETWDFAQKKCGEVWFRWGRWLLLTAAPMLFVIEKSEDAVSVTSTAILLLQIIPLLAAIYPVEKALKETFDEDGYPLKQP